MPNATGPEVARSHRSLAPAAGVTPPPKDGSSYRFLSDVIIARELVEPAAMEAALRASLTGRCLTEILVDNGELGEDDLARTLAEHHRLDHVDLEVFAIDREAVALIAPDLARRFGALPIAFLPTSELVVALYDPNGSTAVLEFAQQTERVIQPAVASRTQIEAVIGSLRHHGQLPPPPAPKADVEERRPLRSVPAGDIVIPSRPRIVERARPAEPSPSPAAVLTHARGTDRLSVEFDGHLDAALRRAEIAERRRHEADERARASEELTRIAEARANAAEDRAQAAEELIDAADARAAGTSTAVATTETLLRLVRACEVLEREAQALAPETQALRAALASERRHRERLEARLADLDSLAEELRPQAPVAEVEPSPVEPEIEYEAASAFVPEPAPESATAFEPEPEAAAGSEPGDIVASPEPVIAAPPVEPVADELAAEPSVAPTIDIVGDPDVPCVPALAPMPSVGASPQSAESTTTKGGLRRLITGRRRSP
ncbi:MAG: type pilus assembly protein PilB [Solirubrobacteraceae bacterium]|nr:type pilus assembly protein PilB [Solirubrobacteraceae bacterium]